MRPPLDRAQGSPLLHGDVCGVDYWRDVPSARDLAARPPLAALVGLAPDPYAGRGLESRSSWAVWPVHARAAVGNLRPDRNDDPPERLTGGEIRFRSMRNIEEGLVRCQATTRSCRCLSPVWSWSRWQDARAPRVPRAPPAAPRVPVAG